MWRTMPGEITDELWEGPLEPANDEELDRLIRELGERGTQTYRDAVRDLPIVKIGKPEIWTLAQFCAPAAIPSLWQAKMNEADFYVIEFRCSFRPINEESKVEWAGFLAELLPDAGLNAEISDLYPLEVTGEIKRDVTVSLGPKLKFEEVKASLGSVDFGIKYTELQPQISGAGAGEDVASWHYNATRGASVQGAKFMHALVKAPKGMANGRVMLDLAADVNVRGSILKTLVFPQQEKRRDRLTVQLWGKSG